MWFARVFYRKSFEAIVSVSRDPSPNLLSNFFFFFCIYPQSYIYYEVRDPGLKDVTY